jgi:hypothetical protein
MGISTCPIAEVNAPVERVWAYLAQPSNYDHWWDAHTVSIVPPGPARAGQRILARSRGFGREWPVAVVVRGVDAGRHALELTTILPLGITIDNHISCAPVGPASCRVAFG